MLLILSEYLAKFYTGFHVFQYLTLRAILAAVTTLFMGLFLGPRMIAGLTRYQIGQQVRSDGPQTHLSKKGTPANGPATLCGLAIETDDATGLARRVALQPGQALGDQGGKAIGAVAQLKGTAQQGGVGNAVLLPGPVLQRLGSFVG